jgi:hypothetical protein
MAADKHSMVSRIRIGALFTGMQVADEHFKIFGLEKEH